MLNELRYFRPYHIDSTQWDEEYECKKMKQKKHTENWAKKKQLWMTNIYFLNFSHSNNIKAWTRKSKTKDLHTNCALQTLAKWNKQYFQVHVSIFKYLLMLSKGLLYKHQCNYLIKFALTALPSQYYKRYRNQSLLGL